jgi:hypothetical protein
MLNRKTAVNQHFLILSLKVSVKMQLIMHIENRDIKRSATVAPPANVQRTTMGDFGHFFLALSYRLIHVR